MTLICSNFSPAAGLIAISDILTSVPKRGQAPKISLPLKLDRFSFESSSYALKGTAQKSVVSNATMIQWADEALLARVLIDDILRMSSDGKQFVEKEAAFANSRLSPNELERVSLIYHFRDGPYLQRWSHNAQVINRTDSQMIVTGSGTWDYLQNTSVTSSIPAYGPMFFTAEAISRAFRVLGSELRDTSNYGFHYGGWLEFATAGSNTFNKSRVGLKLWTIEESGELNYFGPVIFTHYHKHDLYIVRIGWQQHEGKIVAVPAIFPIPDFLGRTKSTPSIGELLFAPTLLCHDIFDQRDGSTRNVFDFEWTGIPMKLEVAEGGVDLSYQPTLIKRLMGKVQDPLTFEVRADIHNTAGN